MATLITIHEKMYKALAHAGGRIDAHLLLPSYRRFVMRLPQAQDRHVRSRSDRRFGVDMTGVPCVGDSVRDLEAAAALGAQPILVLTGKGEKTLREGNFPKNTVIFPDLAFVATALLAGD